MPKWGYCVDVGGGIAVDVLSRNVSAWIPAFAGMTNIGVRWRTRKSSKRILVPMTNGRARWRTRKPSKRIFYTHDKVGSRLAAIFCRFPAQTAIRGTPRNRIDHGRHAG